MKLRETEKKHQDTDEHIFFSTEAERIDIKDHENESNLVVPYSIKIK